MNREKGLLLASFITHAYGVLFLPRDCFSPNWKPSQVGVLPSSDGRIWELEIEGLRALGGLPKEARDDVLKATQQQPTAKKGPL